MVPFLPTGAPGPEMQVTPKSYLDVDEMCDRYVTHVWAEMIAKCQEPVDISTFAMSPENIMHQMQRLSAEDIEAFYQKTRHPRFEDVKAFEK
jgi:hypothetical protein